jgi:hypothetical protein
MFSENPTSVRKPIDLTDPKWQLMDTKIFDPFDQEDSDDLERSAHADLMAERDAGEVYARERGDLAMLAHIQYLRKRCTPSLLPKKKQSNGLPAENAKYARIARLKTLRREWYQAARTDLPYGPFAQTAVSYAQVSKFLLSQPEEDRYDLCVGLSQDTSELADHVVKFINVERVRIPPGPVHQSTDPKKPPKKRHFQPKVWSDATSEEKEAAARYNKFLQLRPARDPLAKVLCELTATPFFVDDVMRQACDRAMATIASREKSPIFPAPELFNPVHCVPPGGRVRAGPHVIDVNHCGNTECDVAIMEHNKWLVQGGPYLITPPAHVPSARAPPATAFACNFTDKAFHRFGGNSVTSTDAMRLPGFIDVAKISMDTFPDFAPKRRDMDDDPLMHSDGVYFSPVTWQKACNEIMDEFTPAIRASNEFVVGDTHQLIPVLSEAPSAVVTIHRRVQYTLNRGSRRGTSLEKTILNSMGPCRPSSGGGPIGTYDFHMQFKCRLQAQWACVSAALTPVYLGKLSPLQIKFRRDETTWVVRADVQSSSAHLRKGRIKTSVLFIYVRDFILSPGRAPLEEPDPIPRTLDVSGIGDCTLRCPSAHLIQILEFGFDDISKTCWYHVPPREVLGESALACAVRQYQGQPFEMDVDESHNAAIRRVAEWFCRASYHSARAPLRPGHYIHPPRLKGRYQVSLPPNRCWMPSPYLEY